MSLRADLTLSLGNFGVGQCEIKIWEGKGDDIRHGGPKGGWLVQIPDDLSAINGG